MIAKLDVPHTTSMEIKFIEDMGLFSNCLSSRKELLTGYLRGTYKRTDWDGLNRDVVIAFVHQQLTMLGGIPVFGSEQQSGSVSAAETCASGQEA